MEALYENMQVNFFNKWSTEAKFYIFIELLSDNLTLMLNKVKYKY